MTNKEAVNWLINIRADIGQVRHSELWHYEQALAEIIDMLEAEPEIIRCKECARKSKCRFYDTQGDNGYCRYGRKADE